jgi:hypothetical protein
MTDGILFSLLPGASIGAVYGLSAYISFRVALDRPDRLFMLIVLGGMALRLFIAVLTIALILVLSNVDQEVFLISFFAVFAVGLAAEILFLHRRQLETAKKSE